MTSDIFAYQIFFREKFADMVKTILCYFKSIISLMTDLWLQVEHGPVGVGQQEVRLPLTAKRQGTQMNMSLYSSINEGHS